MKLHDAQIHFNAIANQPFKDLFPKNAYGHIEMKKTDVIISSGITTASNCNTFSFVDPLFMREITIIDLKKNSD